MATKLEYLSSIAKDVLKRCAQKLEIPVEGLVEEFESGWNPDEGDYCKKLVEFCSSKTLCQKMCQDSIQEKINDGSFSRLTYDMMLAWERPRYYDEDGTESVAKEHEERIARKATQEQEDIPLFYSDIMPLLVTNEANVGEDAFVWMGSQFPLVADVANGRFTFETLTAPTGLRLHHPAYDIFLKNMDKCIQHLQNQTKPNGVELADDEYILHVEGTASSQRVVRHIGTTSWPGRLTLTNYALYFEASGIINYEDAIKMDLSKDVEQSVKPAATGPWGAQLFDKAIIYESSDLSEEIVLEFPELTSSTRREHWLALIREIMFLHQFLSKYNINGPIQAWEIHARTILGIIRLHAAREMLRISPPVPTKFLIFSLYHELPKGDYVLEEFADSLEKVNSGHSCSASSILRIMNMYRSIPSDEIVDKPSQEVESSSSALEDSPSLKTAIKQSREEEKEVLIAKATTEELKDDGVIDSVMVLTELLKPLKHVVPWVQGIFAWERPINTVAVLVLSLIITYMEWVGKAIACFLIWVIVKMLEARKNRICEKRKEIVISRTSMASDQSTVESIVSAQHGLYTVHEIMQIANIAMLKIWSILIYKADKHANVVMVAMSGLAFLLAVIPFKYFLMGIILQTFATTLKRVKLLPSPSSSPGTGNRRLREWWDSIPIVPVRVVDNALDE
ncbi:uncharacterized protein LOC130944333 isoform X2 [Arachis stenosperma]|uniref:uncharacterized protein LOC130944333 isoform X2 n=1 Tax=Arachis stenosperma TaxID=217475 RepID=UPI0025AD6D7B|nr:uncharacterized protein LOC130944333 isoform X2 [Arachis stenosperma]